MARGKMKRRLSHGEKVSNGRARGSVCERSGKRWIALSCKVSEGIVSDFIEVRCAFERAVENAPTGAETSGTGFAQNLAEQTIIVAERIRQSQSRREIVPTGGCQRARNMRISGKHPP